MSAMTPTDAVNVLKFLERTRANENNPEGAAMLKRVEAHLSAWVSKATSEPINDGGPVHPCRIPTGGLHACDEPPPTRIHFGKSLRDDFAGLAMQGFLAGHISYHGHGSHWPYDQMASEAFDVADAMLAAREKGGA